MLHNFIAFDLDGTLVTTAPAYRYDVVTQTLKALGRSANTDEMDHFWFGTNRDSIIQKIFDLSPADFWSNFVRFDLPHVRLAHTKPFPDIGALDVLKGRGLRLGVVTNAPKAIAESELGLIGADIFDAIVIAGKTPGVRPKPHPDGILHCIAQGNGVPQGAMFIGNALEDLQAARAAEVVDVHIDRGEHDSIGDLLVPSHSISSLEEIAHLLK